MDLLDKEIPKLKDKITSVHLCFSTDPFMYHYPEIIETSIAAIRKLNAAGIKCTVLTKGVLPQCLSELSKENEYGITLISLNDNFHKEIEPGSAPIKERLTALKSLHDSGCKTWISIEPYPTPNIIKQDLIKILEAVSFVDYIIFGKMNYNKEVNLYNDNKLFYNKCTEQVIEFCKEHGIRYHIKSGTNANSG